MESLAMVKAPATSSATTSAAPRMDISLVGVAGAGVARNVEVANRGDQGGARAENAKERAALDQSVKIVTATLTAAQWTANLPSGVLGRSVQ
jgi:hypothetical protein